MGTRNILASPSTLGFDGLSILWVLVGHSLMLFISADYPIINLLLLGIPFFVGVGLFYSRFIHQSKNIEKVILLGLTFNLMVGAIFSLWQFLFFAFNLPFPVELWFGHFRFSNTDSVIVLFLVELLMGLGWFLLRSEFYLFSLGKNLAMNWKLKEVSFYLFLFVMVGLGTFTVVSLFGAFSFLALIFPIIARKLWFKKFDLAGEIFVGSICNGLLLLLIDLVCYHFPVYGAEIPVGLIATAVGALSLIILMWKSEVTLGNIGKAR